MSIWCNWSEIGTDVRTVLARDEHDRPILVKHGRQPKPERGVVRSYASGWSNHYPTTTGRTEQPANVGISHIPVWCVPGHRGEFTDDIQTAEHDFYAGGKPTGRYELATVVMDEEAARSLAADLLEWADRPKASPTERPNDRHVRPPRSLATKGASE